MFQLFLSGQPNSGSPHVFMNAMVQGDFDDSDEPPSWRFEERMKTVGVLLCLCLNIGTDPPDAPKTSPCARHECWIDPKLMGPNKAIDAIAARLEKQYQRWQPRARYKPVKDPTYKDVKKMCIQLRRAAKTERLLFHYNGHGVPKPTANGEIWVFNKNFTQYIPLGLHELSSWLRRPAIYVFDCPGAGVLLPTMQRMLAAESSMNRKEGGGGGGGGAAGSSRSGTVREVICFAACGADQRLPLNPAVPADVFTACLTTPIQMALRWFMHRNPLQLDLPPDIVDRIPGKLNDRKTPFGELNWIFTSITDTIAWNVLPLPLFQKLFRQDLLLASLSRNFLLADRILRSLHCTPKSIPALPSTVRHPLWQSWDLAVEQCLSQLPAILSPSPLMRPSLLSAAMGTTDKVGGKSKANARRRASTNARTSVTLPAPQFRHSNFFREQLTAFEVWLRFVDVRSTPLASPRRRGSIRADAPEHLPIVLQVLLSQVHRVRALRLLAEFVDLGRWAVNLALSVGVHPYVLKLLHSPTPKLRPILVFIWAKILDLDVSCQDDLLKSNGHKYFLRQLRHATTNADTLASTPSPSSSTAGSTVAEDDGGDCDESPSTAVICRHQRWLSSYILARLMHRSKTGKRKCLAAQLHRIVAQVLVSPSTKDDPRLCRWLCVVLAMQWRRCHPARRAARDGRIVESVLPLLESESSLVRATATLAIGELFGIAVTESSQVPMRRRVEELRIARLIIRLTSDCAVAPREQMLYALARLVIDPYHNKCFQAAAQAVLEHKRRQRSRASSQRAAARDRKITKKNADVAASSESTDSKLAGVAPSNSSPRASGGVSVLVRAMRRMRDLSPRITEEETESYVFVWRVVRNMKRNDPAQSVRRIAAALVKYVHTKMMEQLRQPKTDIARTKTAGTGQILSTSAAESNSSRKSIESFRGESPPPSLASRFKDAGSKDGMKKVASMDFAKLERGRSDLDADSPASERGSDRLGVSFAADVENAPADVDVDDELELHDLVSPLLDDSCRRGVSWPLLRTCGDEDDPMSSRGAVLRYRRQRNRSAVQSALRMQSRREAETICKFKQSSILDNGSIMSSVLLFHPYESTLVVATGRDEIKVWNYEEGENVGQFRNQNEKPSRITSLSWINPHDDALLLAGSDDGVVRVWSSPCEQPHLTAAFTAVPDLVAGKRGSGLVTRWQQERGLLLAAGNSTLLRTWDLRTETCVSCVSTGCPASCVTSMASWNRGDSVVLACGDGSLHCFDMRSPASPKEAHSVREHKNWVVDVHRQRGSEHLLLSCSVSGDVKFWDNRKMASSVATIKAHSSGEPCTAFASHDYAPILASGSHKQFIRIFDMRNKTNTTVHYHDGFLGQRIGPVSCLTFHPFKMCLAAGATDSIISIYTAKK